MQAHNAGTHQPAVEPAVARARNLWRAAEDRLYPTLISDPSSYQRAIADVQAVVAELRKRCDGVHELMAVEANPDDVIAAACPAGTVIPVDLLIAVGCGMADREMAAERERRRRIEIIEAARAAGQEWVVLAGPDRPTALHEGRLVELHVPSGTILEASVDPWSGGDPYRVEVTITAKDGQHQLLSRDFDQRTDWLIEYGRCRADIAENGTGPALEAS
ncbi:hypothetical protein ACVGVM_22305 [Pseudonocardia bannensis]|uniref:Uncharacterized protein n=1 Tax=Pseudonocardia bannensis TaxID=630973 RepID=A0A848DMK0_9PSEU|nr:hypothetical protein [Pseudonocardia bannensis]NMH93938.1 hypothetical protein [Pseudonocardia bannensis]